MNSQADSLVDAGEQNSPQTEWADDVLIILPVRNLVLYPGIVHPVTIGRP